MRIKLVDEQCMPYKKHEYDAGWDLKARITEPAVIMPHKVLTVPVGVMTEIPNGYVGDIRPRSGLAKRGIVAQYGTVDATYRGEIRVTLINVSEEPYEIVPYERIAQLVVLPIFLEKLELTETLSETERGAEGFGSTGKF